MTQLRQISRPALVAAAPDHATAPFVLGSITERLTIEQITCDVSDLLGFTADELVGRSLLTIVAPEDRSRLAGMINRTAAFRSRTAQALRFMLRTGGTRTCHLLLMPASPRNACAFLIATGAMSANGTGSTRVAPAQPLHAGPSGTADPLATLTTRERQIVDGIARGDRVPAIARALYLSRGTVRNHLSSAYRKLGVPGQQELIDLLREQR
ncbi:MAG: hypothetical protein QOE97_3204 [Pseudonocardiales bacterium]|nr:hypothetical protein [Pseudonocardiales bacterium]